MNKYNVGDIGYYIDNNKIYIFKINSIFISNKDTYYFLANETPHKKDGRLENTLFATKELAVANAIKNEIISRYKTIDK